MPTLNIQLSNAEKAFVDAHVTAGGLSPSEYISFLIQMERLKKHRDKIEALLLEGINSGPATPMTRQDWKEIETEGLARLAQEKKNASNRPKKPHRTKRSA